MKDDTDRFSAAAQSLGFFYQPRFALLRMLQLDEKTGLLIEKSDDLDFSDKDGKRELGSLKHKEEGGKISDLSVDFWKSVRVWLDRYEKDNRIESHLRFFLFSTEAISDGSFLKVFVPDAQKPEESISTLADQVLAASTNKVVKRTRIEFDKLTANEKEDFLSRINIIEGNPRIGEIPTLIKNLHMRTIRVEFRDDVFERLEGWWNNQIIDMLDGTCNTAMHGYELSEKLQTIADEYKSDNLPITFRNQKPTLIDTVGDKRLFVEQLRAIDISTERIERAIVDYYQAFQQRSEWTRKNVVGTSEIENYEERLEEEWSRYKEAIFEGLDSKTGENILMSKGKELYKWAEFNCTHVRIRDRVTEPYVTRGGFHILANCNPPRVHWHPLFLERLSSLLAVQQ